MNKNITLAHGSGGGAMKRLIQEMFVSAFENSELDKQEDQARFALSEFTAQGGHLAFSTDSYVVDPIFFPGGDIGTLAVCGTANDVAMSGAIPRYLSCAFILEEGFALTTLQRIVKSMAETAKKANVEIVTGDTKVVAHGAADKIFINTSGIGVIPHGINWAATNIKAGDKIIVSGTIGDHGATILNLRESLGLDADISSDCRPLYPVVKVLLEIKGVRALRDATRGGVTAIMHEFKDSSGCGFEIKEADLPINPAVRGVCELLGLDPLNFANEGKLIAIVSSEDADQALLAMRNTEESKEAAVIGEVNDKGVVTVKGGFGGTRLLDLPTTEPLPRIC
jgi:hydrogenase expression/formation protein HypE